MAIFGTDINDPKYVTNTYNMPQYHILSGQSTPTLVGLTILGIFLLKATGK